MVKLTELQYYLDHLLNVEKIPDYCPNGLQLEGKQEIHRMVTGVTACQELIEHAIILKADLLLVHHGFFWKGENPCLIGMKYRRIASLIRHNIALIAYHLPLDVHPIYGNNQQLAQQIGLQLAERVSVDGIAGLLWVGYLEQPVSAQVFAERLAEKTGRTPLHLGGHPAKIQRVALCTGAAQDFILQALELGVDAYLTGEVSERTVHIAKECGIHFFASGHHATERYGVQALGAHLSTHFGIEHQFVDVNHSV